MYAWRRLASGSRPARFQSSQNPDLEKGVHGGPPMRRSGRSLPRSPAEARSSLVGTSNMFRRMTPAYSPSKFFSMVSAASSFISTAAVTLKPAASTPRSSPPAPEKSGNCHTAIGHALSVAGGCPSMVVRGATASSSQFTGGWSPEPPPSPPIGDGRPRTRRVPASSRRSGQGISQPSARSWSLRRHRSCSAARRRSQ